MTDQSLQALIEWITGFDPDELRASVANLRLANPRASRPELARLIFRRTAWKCALTGTLMGLPTSLLFALPVVLVEQAIALRLHVTAVAQAALIYDPSYFEGSRSRWDLLKPILAINAGANVFTAGGTLATGGLYDLLGLSPSQTVGPVVPTAGGTPVTVGRLIFDPLQLSGAKRRALLQAIPLASGVVGGVWSWYKVRLLEWRVITFFEGQPTRPALLTALEPAAP